MKVTLNIQDDSDLRSHIKDAIKGQILSIVRDELVQIIKDELDRKLKGTDKYNWDRMIREASKEAIVNKDWKAMVDTLAKEKVKSLIG